MIPIAIMTNFCINYKRIYFINKDLLAQETKFQRYYGRLQKAQLSKSSSVLFNQMQLQLRASIYFHDLKQGLANLFYKGQSK